MTVKFERMLSKLMYIVWLILMALFVGYLAVPALRELGYSYGRFGRLPDILVVVIGTLLLGVVVVFILSSLGGWNDNTLGAIVVGAVGAVVMVTLLTIFSAKAASDEDKLIDHEQVPNKE